MENNLVLDNLNIISENIDDFSLKPQVKALPSLFKGFALAIKVTVLLALSFVYTVIAVPAVILYMLLYERFLAKFIKKVRAERRKAPYYYKWKKHHLDLNWEA
jgi:hypothetical protein